MENMVPSTKGSGVFDGNQVIRAFNDTEDFTVPMLILADPTRIFIRQVEADGTEMNLLLHIQNGPGQLLGFGGTAPQNMKG